MKNFLMCSALAILLLGCQDDSITLSEDDERFAALYADLLLLQVDYERISANGGTFSKLDSLQKLFSLHHLSPAQFNVLFSRYKDDPERWLKVQDRALAMLSKYREQSAFNLSNNQ
jgi:hypothetical protein